MIETKRCSECCRTLPVKENFYLRKKTTPGWYQNKCIECKKDTDTRYTKAFLRKQKRMKSLQLLIGDALYILHLGKKIENISLEMLKARYKELAFENHPDRGGSEEKMIQINAAYNMLLRHLGG